MHARVLVSEDEPGILNLVRGYLEREGYTVLAAADGLTGLSMAREERPDLIVLDLMLPGLDGLELLRRLRQESEVYVLVLTARDDEVDKVVGLSLGADDYLTKPFSPRELVARVRAILRRDRGRLPETAGRVIRAGQLHMDLTRHEARIGGPEGDLLPLTPLEFSLLEAMAEQPGRVFTRDQLIERVWGHDYYGEERVVDVHIGNLRKKLEPNPTKPVWIQTVRGLGYKFVPQEP